MSTIAKKSLYEPIQNHLLDLVYYLDPLASEHHTAKKKKWEQQTSTISFSRWNSTFLFPLLAMIVSSLYGNIFMFYSEKSCGGGQSATLTIESFSQCPVVMYHQVFPREIWAQIDVCYFISALSSVLIYATFLRSPSAYSRTRYELQKLSAVSNEDIVCFGEESK